MHIIGAWALGYGLPKNCPLAASVARVSAIQAYEYAASENIQVHGGMGFTWEADCHLCICAAPGRLALLIGELRYVEEAGDRVSWNARWLDVRFHR